MGFLLVTSRFQLLFLILSLRKDEESFLLFQDRTVRNLALLAFIQSKLIKRSVLPHSKVLHMLNVFIKCCSSVKSCWFQYIW